MCFDLLGCLIYPLIDIEESKKTKRKHYNDLSFLHNRESGDVQQSFQIAPAPRFVIPEFGGSCFDTTCISSPWDDAYHLIPPP
jgi:hypothetical protein